MKPYVYKNPYCLTEEQLKNIQRPNKPEVDKSKTDFDENGLLKRDCDFLKDIRSGKISLEPTETQDVVVEESQFGTMEQLESLEMKIQDLQIGKISKDKLRYFIKSLGVDEKPYSVEQFRGLGGDYLKAFLIPAIDAGIIVKTGSQKSALYKVNYAGI